MILSAISVRRAVLILNRPPQADSLIVNYKLYIVN